MKKLLFMVTAAAMFLMVGCSKESKYESIIREGCKIQGFSAEKTEKEVNEALTEFKKASSDKQEELIKMSKAAIEMMKAMKK